METGAEIADKIIEKFGAIAPAMQDLLDAVRALRREHELEIMRSRGEL